MRLRRGWLRRSRRGLTMGATAQMALPTIVTSPKRRGRPRNDSARLRTIIKARPDPLRLPVGSPRCRCEACGEHFTSVTAFTRHQVLDDAGDVQCYEPDSIGLVKADGWWQ